MLMKLLGVICAMAATGTVLVYGLGLQLQPQSQPPIVPLQSKQEAPLPTPKAPAVVSSAPIQAPEEILPSVKPATNQPNQQVPQSLLPETEYSRVEAQAVDGKAPSAVSTTNEMTLPSEPVAEPVMETLVAPIVEDTSADQVFVFWQPFRSRGSAQGFAQGLSARAEVPVSVISEETDAGRYYRVVLPYNSEAQRLERLAKLESATRLEMGE